MMKLRNQISLTGRRENWLRIAGGDSAFATGGNHRAPRSREENSIMPTPRPKGEIVVPIAFTPACEEAAKVAIEMAERMDCGALFVHVAEPSYGESFLDAFQRNEVRGRALAAGAERLKRFLRGRHKAALRARSIVKTGLPSYEILRVAESVNARWIVMGRARRNLLNRMVFGSVSSDIIDLAPCPVVLVNGEGRGSRARATPFARRAEGA